MGDKYRFHLVDNIDHVDILPFGQENLDYITDIDWDSMIEEQHPVRMQIMINVCKKAVCHIYCNREHPENINVYMPEADSDIVYYYSKSKKWHRTTFKLLFEQIATRSISAVLDTITSDNKDATSMMDDIKCHISRAMSYIGDDYMAAILRSNFLCIEDESSRCRIERFNKDHAEDYKK